MEEEEEIDERDHDRLFDEGPSEGGDGALDQGRAIVEGHDADPRGQPGPERRDLDLDAIDDLHRAHAVPGHHDPTHRLRVAFDKRGRPEGIADLYVRHLADEDRDTVVPADHHLLKILGALDQTQATDDGPGAAPFDHVAADIAIASHHRIDDGGDGDPEGAKALGIDVHLVLADRAPHTGHLGHAGHRVELIADVPVLDRTQLAERLALTFDRVPEDVSYPRGVGPQRRHDPRRQRLGEQVQPLEDPGPREVEVDRVLEDHVDHREPEGRRGP